MICFALEMSKNLQSRFDKSNYCIGSADCISTFNVYIPSFTARHNKCELTEWREAQLEIFLLHETLWAYCYIDENDNDAWTKLKTV